MAPPLPPPQTREAARDTLCPHSGPPTDARTSGHRRCLDSPAALLTPGGTPPPLTSHPLLLPEGLVSGVGAGKGGGGWECGKRSGQGERSTSLSRVGHLLEPLVPSLALGPATARTCFPATASGERHGCAREVELGKRIWTRPGSRPTGSAGEGARRFGRPVGKTQQPSRGHGVEGAPETDGGLGANRSLKSHPPSLESHGKVAKRVPWNALHRLQPPPPPRRPTT